MLPEPSWDKKYQLMDELGALYLWMERPFLWKVRHDGVLIVDEDDDYRVPEGYDTNPYGAVDSHWLQLTHPGTILQIWKPSYRLVRWTGFHFEEIDTPWPLIEAT